MSVKEIKKTIEEKKWSNIFDVAGILYDLNYENDTSYISRGIKSFLKDFKPIKINSNQSFNEKKMSKNTEKLFQAIEFDTISIQYILYILSTYFNPTIHKQNMLKMLKNNSCDRIILEIILRERARKINNTIRFNRERYNGYITNHRVVANIPYEKSHHTILSLIGEISQIEPDSISNKDKKRITNIVDIGEGLTGYILDLSWMLQHSEASNDSMNIKSNIPNIDKIRMVDVITMIKEKDPHIAVLPHNYNKHDEIEQRLLTLVHIYQLSRLLESKKPVTKCIDTITGTHSEDSKISVKSKDSIISVQKLKKKRNEEDKKIIIIIQAIINENQKQTENENALIESIIDALRDIKNPNRIRDIIQASTNDEDIVNTIFNSNFYKNILEQTYNKYEEEKTKEDYKQSINDLTELKNNTEINLNNVLNIVDAYLHNKSDKISSLGYILKLAKFEYNTIEDLLIQYSNLPQTVNLSSGGGSKLTMFNKSLDSAMSPIFDHFKSLYDPIYSFLQKSVTAYTKGDSHNTKTNVIPLLLTLHHICSNIREHGMYRITNINNDILLFVNHIITHTEKNTNKKINKQLLTLPKVYLSTLFNKTSTYKPPTSIPYIQLFTYENNLNIQPNDLTKNTEINNELKSFFNKKDVYILNSQSSQLNKNIPINIY